MDKKMQKIAEDLLPEFDYIFNLYDLSLQYLSEKSLIAAGADKNTKFNTLFDAFDVTKEDVNDLVLKAPEKGEMEFIKNVRNLGSYKFVTIYKDFEFDNEPYRVGKFTEIKKLS